MNNQPIQSVSGNILIVDDTPANLRLLSQMLAEHGYKARVALDGDWALTTAQAAPPDLIVLDIVMPGMDGYEVCRRLKADVQLHDIPVLFISALDEVEDKVKGFAAGGVDYITKPFQQKEVLVRIQTQLAVRNLQRQIQATNAELAQRLEELQARNEELDAFAHTVAHDLRAFAAGVVSFAELLQSPNDLTTSETLQQAMHGFGISGRKMINVIEELLLLAGVRNAQVEAKPLEMASIVAEATQRLTYMIKDSGAEIILPSSWPTVLGHGPWVEEVWVNYLSNAIKYGGRPPRVELGADLLPGSSSQAEEDLDGRMVRFWVHDHGPGISSDQQAQLFVPFTRLGQVETKGHGLGLSIVRRIITKLGGQVGIESQGVPGLGSRFTFTLPTT